MSETIVSEDILASNLREACKREGLREFCRKHSLDPGNVSNVCRGKRRMQKKMAEALGWTQRMMYARERRDEKN